MTFRSRQMGHYQLIIPRENAYNVINQLAMYEMAHVVDNGDLINRQFYPQIKRCEELLIKIESIMEKLKTDGIQFEEYDQQEKLFIEKLYFLWAEQAKKLSIMPIKMLDKVENDIHREFKRFKDIDDRLEKTKASKKQLLEKIACYQTIDSFFGESYLKRQSQDYFLNNIASAASDEMSGVSYMVGVIDSKNLLRLSRMIYRVSRGYACIKQMSSFEFEPLKIMSQKIVLIIYPTSRTSVLQKKIQRVVETFCHNFFLFNKMQNNTRQSLQQLRKQYNQVSDFIEMNEKEMKDFLHQIKSIRYLQSWRIFLWKERVIYETLNKFQSRQQIIYGELYVPKDKVELLGKSFGKMSPSPTIHQIELGKPPTAFDTNSYTVIAQQITNTYGTPRYQQVNPSILTTVTFPFFFGVMFGDIAHGGVLLIFGAYLVFWNDTIKRSALKMFSDLRYMILMMGFFAFYCGWIYNDFMGMNMNFLGSCYNAPAMPDEQGGDLVQKQMFPRDPQCIYPFGVDPIWGRSKNNLQFVNSLKMKISVIIAIVHMTLGVIIKAFNSVYFKKRLDFYFEFIPQFIFLFLLFGYMDFLIVFKWLKYWPEKIWAPSIISTMMNIGLKLGETSTITDGASNMWGERGKTSQDSIQMVILVISFICVPLMLIPKPVIQIKKIKAASKHNPLIEQQSQMELERELNPSNHSKQTKGHNDDHGHAEPNEIFVHQLIQTIEYVLGAISNTASYLRLWALSLAHSQLALVFFQKTLSNGFTFQASVISPFVVHFYQQKKMTLGFYALIWVTFGILMCMDTMECFLHSLRLHWVEFQNKFYKGDGYKYIPLSYKAYIMEKKTSSANV